jgi:hypothetical protein
LCERPPLAAAAFGGTGAAPLLALGACVGAQPPR